MLQQGHCELIYTEEFCLANRDLDDLFGKCLEKVGRNKLVS